MLYYLVSVSFYLNYQKFRLLLGPLEIQDPKGVGKSEFINIGDIPVSSKYFAEWVTEKLIKKEQATYPLARFLTDFFNTLVRGFLNDGNNKCFKGGKNQFGYPSRLHAHSFASVG